jgi:hypothetical protein
MASENLAKLQATLNRYASEAGFSQLAIDGGMGDKTSNGVFRALGWVGGTDGCVDGDGGVELCVDQNDKETARSLLTSLITDSGALDHTKVMQANVGLNTFLTKVADGVDLQPAATVSLVRPPSGGTLPDRGAFNVQAPPGAGTWMKTRLWFTQLPQWQQAGIGIGGGIALLIAFTKFRKPAKKGR